MLPGGFPVVCSRLLRLYPNKFLMHVGSPDKKSKTEAMYYPARNGEYEAGDIRTSFWIVGA